METDDPAVVHDAVDDRGGHVPVAEHVAPPAELEVRGEDDAAGLVAVRDDLEQKPGPVDVDGQVAELVDDDQPGPADRSELGVRPVLVLGLPQPHDQARGGEEPDGNHALAGEHADRDVQVGLAAADVAVEHEVLGPVDEIQAFQLLTPPVGWERGHAPVVAVKGLVLGEAGLFEQPPAFGFDAARVLPLEQVGEEAELARGRVPDGVAQHAVGQWQVPRGFHDPFGRGLVDHAPAAFAWLSASCAHSVSSMYLSWRFRSCPPSAVLPSRMRLAHAAIAARSMVRPASMTVSTALTAAANPHSADTARMPSSRSARARPSMRSSRERTVPGKSLLIGLSPHMRGLRAMIASRLVGSAWVLVDFPPHAFQRDDMPAVGIAKLYPEDAHPGLQTHRAPFRTGQIPVRVDDDGACLVGLHAPPVARVETDAGQGQHVVLLRPEQIPHRNAVPVMVRSGDAFARVEPHAGQRPEALGRRHRHHQVAPDEADCVLHAALLMAGTRVAEPGLEPVARAEQGEQAGLGDRAVGVAVARAGGVVEHHHPGRHARPLEHLQQTLAHAFRGLARQRHRPAHVRIRERHRQEMHDPLHARDHDPRLAEIDLGASRRPLQLGEAVRLRAMLLPPTFDPALHRRVRARESAFRHEPLVHAGRGMALLDRHAQIGGQPSVDDGGVPVVDQRPARSRAIRWPGRIIPVVGVLDHSRARYAEPS